MHYIPTFLNESTDYTISQCFGHFIKTTDKTFLDLTGGLTSHSVLAWNRTEIKEAISDQLNLYTHCDYKTFFDPLREELSKLIMSGLPIKLQKSYGIFFPGLSGSEGIESALKLSYQYRIENNDCARNKIIFFEEAYHGSTLGALSMTDRPNLKQYNPLFPDNYFKLSEVNYFRKNLQMSEEEYCTKKIQELEALLSDIDAEKVTALVGETISGGLTGYTNKPKGYWNIVREICSRHNIHLIMDEIICGTGTTGKYFCWEYDNFSPCITVMGKTLAAGYMPLSALVVNKDILNVFKEGSGRIQQSNTFQGHSLAVAAAVATNKIILGTGFLKNVRAMGENIKQVIEKLLQNSNFFRGVNGRGLRFSIFYDCKNQDAFGRTVTKKVEMENNIIIDGKWHRITFSPALDFETDQLIESICKVCNAFMTVEKEWDNYDTSCAIQDYQKRS